MSHDGIKASPWFDFLFLESRRVEIPHDSMSLRLVPLAEGEGRGPRVAWCCK